MTRETYQAIFDAERAVSYPVVEAFEERMGFAIDRQRLEDAARILACPLKANPPNWQHGRVIYAAVRRYLVTQTDPITALDIGTAKGFSALCLRWAIDDAPLGSGVVYSVDVRDPIGRERRNSVLEVDGPKALADFLAPWPEAKAIHFLQCTGVEWLRMHQGRVHVAFVDGKHSYEAVVQEARLLADRQQEGDLVIFDDAQIEGVSDAIGRAANAYHVSSLDILPNRRYAVGVRRG